MNISSVRAVPIRLAPNPTTPPRVAKDPAGGHFVSPMDRYAYDKPGRSWAEGWPRTACVVTADDGTWGLGFTHMAGPVCSIINDHFAHLLDGQNPMATEKLWDMMRRSAAPYGASGVASYAISAVDNALWDLKGKLLGRPVYELLGGPVKDRIFCYASNTMLDYKTSDYLEWYLELGFKAVKVFLRHGPDAGLAGLNKNVELVAQGERAGRARHRAGGGLVAVAERGVRRARGGGAEAVPDQVARRLPAAGGYGELR